MKRLYFLSVAAFLGIVILTIVTSAGRMVFYLCLPCLLLVTVTPFVVLLATFSPAEMARSFRVAFQRAPADEASLRTAAAFFRASQIYVVLSGLMGALVGLVAMLAELSGDTEVGFGLALVLLTLLYSILILFILVVPFRTALARKLENA